ncbi:hypothetical protein [Sphingobacterium thalpophilum]|uniref:hypothetical protein n=1 Tax=Sphingobacterium thalpophilum TaxID=259 RepID=UPI0024A682CE|nr:hypothetical protein [Sphingobacterium thalpophilum]
MKKYCNEIFFQLEEKLNELSFEVDDPIYLSEIAIKMILVCYIGKKAQVISKNLVHIFVAGKQVALHQRSPKQNAYTTLEEHLDARHREFRKKNPAHYLTRANAIVIFP